MYNFTSLGSIYVEGVSSSPWPWTMVWAKSTQVTHIHTTDSDCLVCKLMIMDRAMKYRAYHLIDVMVADMITYVLGCTILDINRWSRLLVFQSLLLWNYIPSLRSAKEILGPHAEFNQAFIIVLGNVHLKNENCWGNLIWWFCFRWRIHQTKLLNQPTLLASHPMTSSHVSVSC